MDPAKHDSFPFAEGTRVGRLAEFSVVFRSDGFWQVRSARTGREPEGIEAMVQRVTHNGRLLAIIVPRDFGEPGVNFITEDDATLQLGLLNHPKSKIIQPHAHKVRPREVTVTQEVLVLRKGKLRVDFYDDDETYLESRILEQGDTILLVSGGHGFEVLEDVDIIEVKTGPYLGEDEKIRFGPARPAHLKITG